MDTKHLSEIFIVYLVSAIVAGAIGQFWALGVVRKNGPAGVFAKLRRLGKPFTCAYCLCFWTACLAYLVVAPPPALAVREMLIYLGGMLAGPGFGIYMQTLNGEIVAGD